MVMVKLTGKWRSHDPRADGSGTLGMIAQEVLDGSNDGNSLATVPRKHFSAIETIQVQFL